jgi:hypothetical protein
MNASNTFVHGMSTPVVRLFEIVCYIEHFLADQFRAVGFECVFGLDRSPFPNLQLLVLVIVSDIFGGCVLAITNLQKHPVYCSMHILLSIHRIDTWLGDSVSEQYVGFIMLASQEAIAAGTFASGA